MESNESSNETSVLVVFRKEVETQQVIALMPELPHDIDGHLCISYAHVGQHGGADLGHVLHTTEPANPDEYARLEEELEEVGYKLLVFAGEPAAIEWTNWNETRWENARDIAERIRTAYYETKGANDEACS